MPERDFTLPPGIEVPELALFLYVTGDGSDEQCAFDHIREAVYDARLALAALCRVVREQDRMLRLAWDDEEDDHEYYFQHDWPDSCDAWLADLRRRVREEAATAGRQAVHDFGDALDKLGREEGEDE